MRLKKIRIWTALILQSPLPLLLFIETPLAFDRDSILAILSAATSIMAATYIVWQLTLSVPYLAEKITGDVQGSVKIYRLVGKIGVGLALLHPLLISFALFDGLEAIRFLLTPSIATGTDLSYSFGRLALFLILTMTVSTIFLKSKIGFQAWKKLHLLSYPIFVLIALHSLDIGSTIQQNWLTMFIWYGIILAGLLATLFRVLQSAGLIATYHTSVVAKTTLNADVTVIALKLESDTQFSFRAGQFAWISLGRFKEKHPFSIVDYSDDEKILTLAIKDVGSFSSKISQIEAGAEIFLDGPYGMFTENIDHSSSNNVFIAGGIGITPFVSHCVDDNDSVQTLLYANRDEERSIFLDLLRESLGERLVEVYSKDDKQLKPQSREAGYVNASIISKYVSNPEGSNFFICGPPAMIDFVVQELLSLGVDHSRISVERFDRS